MLLETEKSAVVQYEAVFEVKVTNFELCHLFFLDATIGKNKSGATCTCMEKVIPVWFSRTNFVTAVGGTISGPGVVGGRVWRQIVFFLNCVIYFLDDTIQKNLCRTLKTHL